MDVKRLMQVALVAVVAAFGALSSVTAASAQDVTLSPNAVGMPGAGFIQNLLNWAGQLALWSGLGAFVVGAGWWAWSRANAMSAGMHKGQQLLLGGGLAAVGVGLAPTVINLLNAAARS